MRSSSARISPTAFYTGHVWVRHGLAPAGFASAQGRIAYAGLRPFDRLFGTREINLERVLLERHRLLDHALDEAIHEGRVAQVLELASGLSPRGVRMAERHPTVRYVEADLPAMAQRKRQLLERRGGQRSNHRVLDVDVFAEDGASSLESLFATQLSGHGPVAVVTEGLIPYFGRSAVEALWRRLGQLMADEGGTYLSDIYTRHDAGRYIPTKLLVTFLRVFSGGTVQLHFEDRADALQTLASCFGRARTLDAWSMPELFPERQTDAVAVHVGQAWVEP